MALLTHRRRSRIRRHERDQQKAETHWRRRNIFARSVVHPFATTMTTGNVTGFGMSTSVTKMIG
jgi:hypothetical protein